MVPRQTRRRRVVLAMCRSGRRTRGPQTCGGGSCCAGLVSKAVSVAVPSSCAHHAAQAEVGHSVTGAAAGIHVGVGAVIAHRTEKAPLPGGATTPSFMFPNLNFRSPEDSHRDIGIQVLPLPSKRRPERIRHPAVDKYASSRKVGLRCFKGTSNKKTWRLASCEY